MRTFRLVHVGVAAALAAAAATSVGLIRSVTAAGTGTVSSFVPIVPCRLADTRPAPYNVGSRGTPLGAGETLALQVTGTNGGCTIPAGATGIAANVTAVDPTAAGYVTLFPSDAATPNASNLNVVPNGSPTPNQVTVALSASGAVSVFNFSGTVNIVIDIAGYYTPATSGVGPKGDKGDTGAPGPTCPTTGCVTFFTGTEVQQNMPGGYGIEPAHGCMHINPASPTNFGVLDFGLPAGATITDVTVLYLDTNVGAGAGMTFTLNRYGGLALGTTPASTPVVSLNNSIPLGLSLLPAAQTPVSTTAQYFLTAGAISNINALAQYLCGAQVTYTMP